MIKITNYRKGNNPNKFLILSRKSSSKDGTNVPSKDSKILSKVKAEKSARTENEILPLNLKKCHVVGQANLNSGNCNTITAVCGTHVHKNVGDFLSANHETLALLTKVNRCVIFIVIDDSIQGNKIKWKLSLNSSVMLPFTGLPELMEEVVKAASDIVSGKFTK